MRRIAPEPFHARRRPRRFSSPWRMLSLLLGSTVLLAGPGPAEGNPLRRPGAVGVSSPADAALAASAAQSAALALQEQSPLRQAMDAIKRAQAAQAAAAAAAQAAASGVPDGTLSGGLVIDPDPSLSPVNISSPATSTVAGRTEVTLTQSAQRAIVNWSSFNVGKLTDLYFDQTAGGSAASSWVVLNRITGGNPSQILGSIKAEGQVYVINPNGILFGGSSQVNAGTLVLSGLDLPTLKLSGVAVPESNYPSWSQAFLDPASTSLYSLSFASTPSTSGSVDIEPGAQITAATGGRVLLAGLTVTNQGSILVPDGQVFLVAGSRVTLTADNSTNGPRGVALDYAQSDLGGGVVSNAPGALISAPLGTVGMIAQSTNQDGTLTLTTGAQVNGVVFLGASAGCSSGPCTTSFGPGSVTQILPDVGGQKVLGSGAAFTPSQINVSGDVIDVLDGATLYAPAGGIALNAQMTTTVAPAVTDPSKPGYDPVLADDTRIYLAPGSRLDVSGLTDVQVAMEQNVVRGELRANELRDNPVLRDSPLRSQTVYFDVRQGASLVGGSGVADLGGYLNLLERDVSQLMTNGGTVSLTASQVITRQGSIIDLSGGSLQYLPGYVKSTYLIDSSGQRVPIEQALAGVAYVGMDGDFVVSHARWGISQSYTSALSRAVAQYQLGYEQGGSAGTLTIGTASPVWYSQAALPGVPAPPNPSATGAVRVLDGSIVATTVVGPNQRELPSSSVDPNDLTQIWRYQPGGATLNLNQSGDVTFVDSQTIELPSSFAPDTPVASSLYYQALALPTSWFGGTFKSLHVASGSDPDLYASGLPQDNWGTIERAPGGHLTIPAGVVLDLGEGGSFSFSGKEADIEGSIVAPGGSVSLTALQKTGTSVDSTEVHIGSGAQIDVAGRYTNDFVDGIDQPYQALVGGTVSLKSLQVLVDQGSTIDVSGGARLDVKGSTLTAGKAGSISINVGAYPAEGGDPTLQDEPYSGTLLLAGDLRGYALSPARDGAPSLGGKLSITTGSDVVIGGSGTPPGGFGSAFFTQGGFASYSMVGGLGLEVASDAVLAPVAESFTLPPATAATLPSGTRLYDVAGRGSSGDHPTSLTLSTHYTTSGTAAVIHDLTLDPGATIQMVPGSTVQLLADGAAIVSGADGDPRPTTVEAAGGSIVLSGSTVQLLGDSRLLAPGYLLSSLGSNNVHVSTVEAGGNVSVTATSSITVGTSALVDVSGLSAVADLGAGPGSGSRYQAQRVDGDAGTVTLSAPSGLVAGSLRLSEGPAATGGSSLTISSTGQSGLAVFESGSGAPGSLNVAVGSVDASGAANVTLGAITATSTPGFDNSNAIQFLGNVSLESSRSLTLLAPILGTPLGSDYSVTLKSAYVSLGQPYTPLAGDIGTPASAGTGHLEVDAGLVDVSGVLMLTGTSAYGGFATARFVAQGDIRLSDPSGSLGSPGLFSSGSLEFDCAQLYVASRAHATGSTTSLARAADDPGVLIQAGTSITVQGNGNPAPVPFSFGERLTLEAPDIDQGGVVRAPQGEVQLLASHSVTLEPGSITSASLEGATVPFGPVQTGGVFNGYDQAGQAPEKSVTLKAPTVTVKPGATIDVSGGGDLLGYLFTPGNGGSSDLLDSGYAIVPSLGSGPAPLGGTAALENASLAPQQSVYLQGVPGLKDGFYTLLPGHYALLPGAYFLEPQSGAFASTSATVTRADGAVVASGYETYGSNAIANPVWSRFVVMPRGVFGQYSEIDTYSFDAVAAGLASDAGVFVRVPNDAGNAAIVASTSLTLEGTGKFQAGPGGVLGDLDIAAPKIAVLAGGATAPDSSYVTLDATALENFGAGSILLGGLRTPSASGTVVTVSASQVIVDTQGTTLTVPELILAAKADPSNPSSVWIKDGSSIQATAGTAAARFDPSTLILGTSADSASADGALVRLSAGPRVGIVRTNPAGTGVLEIDGASLSAQDSLTLDGSGNIELAPSAVLSSRQLDLASRIVNLGQVPAGTAGTVLSADTLSRLGSLADLLIRGYGAVQVFGDVSLGSRDPASGVPSLKSLTIDTPLLQGLVDGTGQAANDSITAGQLTLRNTGAALQATGATGTGALSLDVDDLVLGPGQVQLSGYTALSGRAGTIEAQGSGALESQGGVALDTAQVWAGRGASYTIGFAGGVQLLSGAGVATDPTTIGLGGSLSIVSAAGVTVDTAVVVPAGTFDVTASSGAIGLGSSASIDVSGRMIDFSSDPNEPVRRFAPGGFIRLIAQNGDVNVDAAATLDVSSGSTQGGDAGTIEIHAGPQSTASVLGSLKGSGGTAADRGGSFLLDSGSADGLTSLLAGLSAGGFDETLSLRLRGSQGITVDAGQTLTAHQVILESDGGQVRVAGTIDAAGTSSHPDGGKVQLIGYGAQAGQDAVTVSGTLDAHAGTASAGGFDPEAPQVLVVANGVGQITLAAGSVIDLSGGASAAGAALPGGSLVLRAPRQGADVAIAPITGAVRGASAVVIQGVDEEAASGTVALSPYLATATTWLAGQEAIKSRIAASDPALLGLLQVGAGIVLENAAGDLSVTSNVDLHGQLGAGYLGLWASGNINVNGAVVSDGFSGANPGDALLSTPSASYDLEAGGGITLTNAMIRTGTGSISLRAGTDITLSGTSSVVYTAGSDTPPSSAFSGRTTDASGDPLYFPTGGGDVSLVAGGDILAHLSPQSSSAWLFRYGGGSGQPAQTSWSVLYASFQQGVGALGGGDVSVMAGGNIRELQVAIPTTGYATTTAGATPMASDLVVNGGGNLEVVAGGNVEGGLYLLGRGQGEIRAGGSVLPSLTQYSLRSNPSSGALSAVPRGAGLLLGLMDGTVQVAAGGEVDVEGVFDPAMQGQVSANLLGSGGTVCPAGSTGCSGSGFWGYTDRTAFTAVSLGGDVHYENDPWASVDLTLTAAGANRVAMAGSGPSSLNTAFAQAPPTLELDSLESSIYLEGHFPATSNTVTLAPAPLGNLQLLAGQDVHLAVGTIQMEDVDASRLTGPLAAFALSGDLAPVTILPSFVSAAGASPLHAGDPDPARIHALNGSVCAGPSGACSPGTSVGASVEVPKPLEVVAGEDVVSGRYQPQGNQASDISLVEAGRDLDQIVVDVMGPGTALLQAGRNIDLVQPPTGASANATNANPNGGVIYSIGDQTSPATRSTLVTQTNPSLPGDVGADLVLLAGVANGVSWDRFAAAYLDPANGQNVAKTYLSELASYMEGIDAARYGAMTPAQLVLAFGSLRLVQRQVFLERIYLNELRQTGIDYNDPQSLRYHSYDRGYRAVSFLFPTDPATLGDAQRGNVILDAKPVETQFDAGIDILAPYGRVDVGAPVVPDSSGASGGIVTRRGGAIQIMADGDISLYTSRVFTLAGGDITMWTTNGNINAGAGSKTSVFQPQLQYTIDDQGAVSIVSFGLQTGAGIGVLDAFGTATDRPKSLLDLVAPRGEVNAGDAGIRVVGDINIAAQVVVGVENISFSGASAGVPAVVAPNIGVLTAASQTAAQAASTAEPPAAAEAEQARQKALMELPSIITVEPVGYETTDTTTGPQDGSSEQRKKRPPSGP